jgi:hypothetical protein
MKLVTNRRKPQALTHSARRTGLADTLAGLILRLAVEPAPPVKRDPAAKTFYNLIRATFRDLPNFRSCPNLGVIQFERFSMMLPLLYISATPAAVDMTCLNL